MDAAVYIKACELAQAITESSEAGELKRIEQEIRNDEPASRLTQEWVKVYERINQLQDSGQQLTEDDERSIEFIEAKVENNPILIEFFTAHQKFAGMLEEINGILMSAMNNNFEEQSDPCMGCPSKGTCDSNADNCSSD